eukprot:Selendium_serpulae@DN10891_c0_g1_i1.p1
MAEPSSLSSANPEGENVLSLWPGLEVQLERSFSSHATALGYDLEDALNGYIGLPYSSLEPVLRHHLMQCGLIEYMTRLVTDEGALPLEGIIEALETMGVNHTNLNISDWKNVVTAWISRVQQLQTEDLSNWNDEMREMQARQAEEYEAALKLFQDQYVVSLQM